MRLRDVLILAHQEVGVDWPEAVGGEWDDHRGPTPTFPWARLRAAHAARRALPRTETEHARVREGGVDAAERDDRQRARRVAFNRAVVAARWESRPRGAREVWRSEAGLGI